MSVAPADEVVEGLERTLLSGGVEAGTQVSLVRAIGLFAGQATLEALLRLNASTRSISIRARIECGVVLGRLFATDHDAAKRCLACLDEVGFEGFRAANGDASGTLASRLLASDDALVRARTCLLVSTPAAMVERLRSDPDKDVRECAKSRLRQFEWPRSRERPSPATAPVEAYLLSVALDKERPEETRVAAVEALATLESEWSMAALVELALSVNIDRFVALQVVLGRTLAARRGEAGDLNCPDVSEIIHEAMMFPERSG